MTVIASGPSFKVIIDDATDNLGIAKQSTRNKMFRGAMLDACRYWRAKHYWRRFVPRIVYAPPYNYQWGMRDRKGRTIPMEKRTPFHHIGMHRDLYMTGQIRTTAKGREVVGRISLPFGHPIPSRVKNSNALRELTRTATYIAPIEFSGMVKVFEEGVITSARKIWAADMRGQQRAIRLEKKYAKEQARHEKRVGLQARRLDAARTRLGIPQTTRPAVTRPPTNPRRRVA